MFWIFVRIASVRSEYYLISRRSFCLQHFFIWFAIFSLIWTVSFDMMSCFIWNCFSSFQIRFFWQFPSSMLLTIRHSIIPKHQDTEISFFKWVLFLLCVASWPLAAGYFFCLLSCSFLLLCLVDPIYYCDYLVSEERIGCMGFLWFLASVLTVLVCLLFYW